MKFSQMSMALAAGVSAEGIMLGADGHGLPPLQYMPKLGGDHDLNEFTKNNEKPKVKSGLLGSGNHDYNTFTAEAPNSIPLLGVNHDYNDFTSQQQPLLGSGNHDYNRFTAPAPLLGSGNHDMNEFTA